MSNEPQEIKIGEKTVKLDSKHMEFDESSLSFYMEHEAAWYDYFGSMLALAEHGMACAELDYDVLYSERFKEHKENGCTEKLSEANAKADPDVEKAKKLYLDAKYKVRLLQQHLRAWDRAHENAQSRGHFLRKEMDKLNKDIYTTSKTDNYLERRIEEIVKEVDTNNI